LIFPIFHLFARACKRRDEKRERSEGRKKRTVIIAALIST